MTSQEYETLISKAFESAFTDNMPRMLLEKINESKLLTISLVKAVAKNFKNVQTRDEYVKALQLTKEEIGGKIFLSRDRAKILS